ncbi:PorV/PorQ family protein [Arthrospiribacter ruber]|uniref:PorV/PorQ family protein n=2 Tax=Arthrospiribacter ruber TaxID=2487934 RepID=A0A951J0F9_9BACT|nr:PorV/PorQ family protein [Arthrospiribacter ruber]MBW3469699.1 PorV/PorQ family protein [Arthrospiribacter ruber]
MSVLRLFVCMLLFALCTEISAQSIAPKYSNEFMNIGIGARALGMGGAQVSSVRDVTAAFWNPAGLIGIKHEHEFSLMHAEYFAGIAKFDYLGYSTAIDADNQIGISVIRFGVDDIPDTRFLYDANGALNYNNIQFFNAADYALLLTYARDVSDNFKFGGNAKIIHRNVGKFAQAWGFGLDLGGIYLMDQWRFGVMLRDVTSTFNAWFHNADMVRDIYSQTNNEIPVNSIELTLPRAIFSVTRDVDVTDEIRVQGVIDLDFTFDGMRNTVLRTNLVSFDPRAGIEGSYKNMVFLRAGGSHIQRIKDFDGSFYTAWKPSFGLGIFLNEKFQIDYALTDIGGISQTPYSHVFSVKVSLKEHSNRFRLHKGWND